LRRFLALRAFLSAALVSYPAFADPAAAGQLLWYRSDAAGIAYERLAEAAALRGEWALSIASSSAAEGRRTETKTLYHHSELNSASVSLLFPSGFPESVETSYPDGYRRSERYDAGRHLIEERSVDAGGEGTVVAYRWDGDRILSSEARSIGAEKGEPLWTDTYRYSRAGALLSVSRTPDGTAFAQESRGGLPRSIEFRGADGETETTFFDGSGREAETVRASADGKTRTTVEKVSYAAASDSAVPGSTRRKANADGTRTETAFDARGRTVSETVYGTDEKKISETRFEWKGERIASRTTERNGVVLVEEYGYDEAGVRIAERDYRNGVLERTVSREGDMENELLYKDGKAVLRATYRDGSLVSEERLR